jgi:RHS repeat-associated protein
MGVCQAWLELRYCGDCPGNLPETSGNLGNLGLVDDVTQRFTGKERDSESGLDYFGARYYGSALGRFTSPDTAPPDLSNPQSWNRYSYSLNNPLRFVDKDGDLYATLYRLQYTVTWTDTDSNGNSTTYSAQVTVYVNVVYNDDGTVAGVNSSGRASNSAGASVNLSDKKLATLADTAASLVRNALSADLGTKFTSDEAKTAIVNAVGLQESKLGIDAGTKNPVNNPLQLSCSSGTCPSQSDRDSNINQSIQILKTFVDRYDVFKGLAKYNGAADPLEYARKVLDYFDQIRGTVQEDVQHVGGSAAPPKVIP